MDAIDEMVKRLCDIEMNRRARCQHQCVSCRDGRLVAGGASPAANTARKYQLCQRCYNDRATRTARRDELGLGAWRRGDRG